MGTGPKSKLLRSIFTDWPVAYPNLFKAFHADHDLAPRLIENLQRSGIEDMHLPDHPVLRFVDDLAASSRLFNGNISTTKNFRTLVQSTFEPSSTEAHELNGERSILMTSLALSELKKDGLIKDFIYTDGPLRHHFRDLSIPMKRLDAFDLMGVDFLVELKDGHYFPLQIKSGSVKNDDEPKLINVGFSGMRKIESEVEDLAFNIAPGGTKLNFQRDIPTQGLVNDLNLAQLIETLREKLSAEELDERSLLHFPAGIAKISRADVLLEMYNKAYIQFPTRAEMIRYFETEKNPSLERSLVEKETKRGKKVKFKVKAPQAKINKSLSLKTDYHIEILKIVREERTKLLHVQKYLKTFMAANVPATKAMGKLMKKFFKLAFAEVPISTSDINKLYSSYGNRQNKDLKLDCFENQSLAEFKLGLAVARLKDGGVIEDVIINLRQSMEESSLDDSSIYALLKSVEQSKYKALELIPSSTFKSSLSLGENTRASLEENFWGLLTSNMEIEGKTIRRPVSNIKNQPMFHVCKSLAKEISA